MTKTSQQDIEKDLVAITSQLLAESGEENKRDIRMDSSLQRHLGIDSLGRAELFQRIEKSFHIEIPDRLLSQAETLSDIASFLREAKPGLKKTSKQTIIAAHGEKFIVDLSKTNTLTDILLKYGEGSPDKPHIYFQNEDGQQEIITYGDMLKKSLQVAQGLQDRGLKEGETVAIMQPTNPGFFYTFFGTLLAGGIPVPIYPPFRMHMLEAYAKTEARILSNAEVRILVTFEQAETLSRLLQTFVPSLKHVTTVADLMQPKILKSPFHAHGKNFALIQYTSGSTADPKGVLLTHDNLLANIRAYGKAIGVTPDDVAVSWLPLYHDMGLIGMWLGSLSYGVPLVLLTPFSFLNHPERWLWAIHYHRGTVSGGPNFAYELCIRKIDQSMIEGLDLSSWRVAANGAEKVYPRTLEEFSNKFGPYGFKRSTFMPMYGLAETAVALAIPPLGRDFRIDRVDRKKFEEERFAEPSEDKNNSLEFAACGIPLEGHHVRIVDDEDIELPERHVGNLHFKGPSSMQGYYRNQRATEAIYHHGWIDSGDLAYMADGEVFITGRRKDLIIKAGRNLYPVEIEEMVGAIPGVREGCVSVFGVTDKKDATEDLVVVAETREKDKAKRAEIVDKIKETISTALDIVPDKVVLVSPHTVPKTSSGKLQRAACKKLYMEGKLDKRHVPAWLQITSLGMQGVVRKCFSGIRLLGKAIYTFYVAVVFTIVLAPVYILVRFAKRDVAAKTCHAAAKLLLKLSLCPVKADGFDKLTQVSPVIFTPNHTSYFDSLVMLALMPSKTHFVVKKELFTTPVLRTFVRALDCVSVDRIDLSKGIEDTKNIEKCLKAGNPILIFPEGTFSYASGLRPFRLGAFKIAVETGTPICPIALKGTRTVLRDDEKLMRPNQITVTVCDLVKPSGSEWKDVTHLRNTVRSEIAKYCGEPSLEHIAAKSVAPKRTE